MDLVHQPALEDGGWECRVCGLELPADSCVGDEVVELGGAGVHFLPAFAHTGKTKTCDKGERGDALIVCPSCDGDGCSGCSNGVVSAKGSKLEIRQAILGAGEKQVSFPRKSDFEKQATRSSVNAFVAMKEMTRPQ